MIPDTDKWHDSTKHLIFSFTISWLSYKALTGLDSVDYWLVVPLLVLNVPSALIFGFQCAVRWTGRLFDLIDATQ